MIRLFTFIFTILLAQLANAVCFVPLPKAFGGCSMVDILESQTFTQVDGIYLEAKWGYYGYHYEPYTVLTTGKAFKNTDLSLYTSLFHPQTQFGSASKSSDKVTITLDNGEVHTARLKDRAGWHSGYLSGKYEYFYYSGTWILSGVWKDRTYEFSGNRVTETTSSTGSPKVTRTGTYVIDGYAIKFYWPTGSEKYLFYTLVQGDTDVVHIGAADFLRR